MEGENFSAAYDNNISSKSVLLLRHRMGSSKFKALPVMENTIHVLRQTPPPTGIVKFNEVYLGEAGADGSEYQDGARSPQSGAGAGGGPLTLEQYIGNAREALGVDSHYSR